MTTIQIIVFWILMLLLLLVGGLLFFSWHRESPSQRTRRPKRGSNIRARDQSKIDEQNSSDMQEQNKAGQQDSTVWSTSASMNEVSTEEQRREEKELPRVITETGQSLERAQGITSRPPVTLRSRSKLYHYTALVTSVYDGDTLTADIDLGMNMWAKNQVIRLWKVNTPEVRGPDRAFGLQVRDEVREMVLDKYVLIRTILDKRGRDQTGKYGRLLGEILVEKEDGTIVNVNDYLLAQNLAIPMDINGVTIKPPANEPVPSKVATPQQSAAPIPEGILEEISERQIVGNVANARGELACSFCGDIRAVDLHNKVVLDCPNCIDGPYQYGIIDRNPS